MDKKIVLHQNEEIRINNGHLWVFSNEIKEISGSPAAGDVVEAYTSSGRLLGVGFYNPKSLIAFRLLSRERIEINVEFWKKRLLNAYHYRKKLYPELDSFRAAFSESDGMPGLVVDKYGDYLSIQMLSAGLETHRDDILEALNAVFSPKGIIARNDSGMRALEGLEEKTEIVSGEIPDQVEITENGVKFLVNLKAGQKTGFFFDQRENRLKAAAYCKDKTVLDCYCHTGAFALHALKAGAKSVTAVDSSKLAVSAAEGNAKLNGLEKEFSAEASDAEQFMEEQNNAGARYDVVIIDPPALIKSKKNSQPGYRLYKKLNSLALRLVKSGGVLVTSSCSHHLSPSDFRHMVEEAAAKTGRTCWLVESGTQAKDHPILLSMPETEYLKLAIVRLS